MVLVDTSVWIHFLRDDNRIYSEEFSRLIINDEIVICPPLIQEILQGIKKDSMFNQVKDLLLALDCLMTDPRDSAIGAAALYRNLRKSGITIRKTNDCLIAWYAIKFKVSLFSIDRDFEMIAKGSKLKIHRIQK
jgi:predicted nucleic acid-binding protein